MLKPVKKRKMMHLATFKVRNPLVQMPNPEDHDQRSFTHLISFFMPSIFHATQIEKFRRILIQLFTYSTTTAHNGHVCQV